MEKFTNHIQHTLDHSGSPFLTCKRCGRTFVDKEIMEPALKPYTGEGLELWRSFFVFLMPWGLIGLMAMVCAFNSNEYAFAATVVSIIFIGIYVALTTYVVVNQKNIIKKDKEEYIESEKRLQNPDYAKALKEAGFDVPDKYLDSKMNANDKYNKSLHTVTSLKNMKIKEEDIEIIRPKVVKKVNVSSKAIRLDDKVKQDVVENGITDHNNESKKQKIMAENKALGEEQEIAFCRKCGTQLLWDSKFCHKCGCEKVH